MTLKLSVLIALATLSYTPNAEPVPLLENPKQPPPKNTWFDRAPCISNTYNGVQNRKQRRMSKSARRR